MDSHSDSAPKKETLIPQAKVVSVIYDVDSCKVEWLPEGKVG